MVRTAPGITIYPTPHGANAIYRPGKVNLTALQLLPAAEVKKVKGGNIIQTSFTDLDADPNEFVQGLQNGFVDTCVQAYNAHHRLVIRPDDLWCAILAQLNIYINKNAEELRYMFIQKSQLLAANLKDPTLLEFFLPKFTTTLKSDQAVTSILMMSTMQKYFSYTCSTCCGLPSVTLLGQLSDWTQLLEKAERLPSFGSDCVTWHSLLVPVLERFVSSYKVPESQETIDFWQKIVHYYNVGSGPTYLSGWIAAFCFCFWDIDGNIIYNPKNNNPHPALTRPPTEYELQREQYDPVLTLGLALYHRVNTNEIPPGWASVAVKIDNDGGITKSVMVTRLVGRRCTSSGEELHLYKTSGEGVRTDFDTTQPESWWWIYEVMPEEKKQAVWDAKKAALEKELGRPSKQWERSWEYE